MIKRLLLFFLISTVGLSVKAQIDHIARYESVHSKDNLDYLVVSNEDKGLLLVKPVIPKGANESKVEFVHLGLSLEEKWEGVIDLPGRATLGGYYYAANITYLMFQVNSDGRFIRIVTIDISKKEIKSYEPKQILDLDISEFEVINGSAVIGGYIEQRPAVFVYNLEKDEVYTLSNVYQNDAELFEVRINSDSVTFNVLVSQFDEKRDKTVLVSTYDYGGNAIRSYQIETDIYHQLLSGVSSSINDKSQVVVGLYGVKVGTYPSGFFINYVDRTGQQTMTYLNFGEFDTFLNHAGKKRSAKMKNKALEAKESSKDWRYKIDVLLNEIIEVDGKLLITGEYFKPWTVGTGSQWRNRDQLSRFSNLNDPFFNPNQPQNMTALDIRSIGNNAETDYTHAFMLVLDQSAKVEWDGSLDINEDVSPLTDNLGAFQWHDGQAYYVYHLEEELRAQHLNNKDDTEGFVTELTLMSEDDKLSPGRGSAVRTIRWHENTFLLYGIQHVKPKDKSENTRKVFFINAIAVGPNMPEKKD